ncbi:MAG: hypothetical protein JSS07_00735 [Proteobacteria bacterium]|nr:hypothetical protein [Pseudomonadota bacterium]
MKFTAEAISKFIFKHWQQPEKRYPLMVALMSFGILSVGTGIGFFFAALTSAVITVGAYYGVVLIKYFHTVSRKLEETLNQTDILLAKSHKDLEEISLLKASLVKTVNDAKGTLFKLDGEIGSKFEDLQKLVNKIEASIEMINKSALPKIHQTILDTQSKTLAELNQTIKELKENTMTELMQAVNQISQTVSKLNKAVNNIQENTLPSLNNTIVEQNKSITNINKTVEDFKAGSTTLNQAANHLNDQVMSQINKMIDSINNEALPKMLNTVDTLQNKELPGINQAIKDFHEKTVPSINKAVSSLAEKTAPGLGVAIDNLNEGAIIKLNEVIQNLNNMMSGVDQALQELKAKAETSKGEAIAPLKQVISELNDAIEVSDVSAQTVNQVVAELQHATVNLDKGVEALKENAKADEIVEEDKLELPETAQRMEELKRRLQELTMLADATSAKISNNGIVGLSNPTIINTKMQETPFPISTAVNLTSQEKHNKNLPS